MKVGEVHIVPLAKQAIALLRKLHKLSGEPIFQPRIKVYGTTIVHETGLHSEVIKRQLAHAERNEVKAAYNHAEYMPERIKMMQEWADWIDALPPVLGGKLK